MALTNEEKLAKNDELREAIKAAQIEASQKADSEADEVQSKALDAETLALQAELARLTGKTQEINAGGTLEDALKADEERVKEQQEKDEALLAALDEDAKPETGADPVAGVSPDIAAGTVTTPDATNVTGGRSTIDFGGDDSQDKV